MEDSNPTVVVEVSSRYIPEQSEPDTEKYVFAYSIQILNQSPEDVQLLERHWEINHADQKSQIVQGHGVVGKQPFIKAGDSFEYSSGSVLTTPIGYMAGHYLMQSASGQQFLVEIPAFSLAVPGALQ